MLSTMKVGHDMTEERYDMNGLEHDTTAMCHDTIDVGHDIISMGHDTNVLEHDTIAVCREGHCFKHQTVMKNTSGRDTIEQKPSLIE